jgi:mRNA interferase ChpB
VERGDIWLVSLDPTAGHEQQGTRPVLIVSPAPFNKLTGTPVVLPITTGGSFARRRGFAVSLQGAGTRTTGVIRCDQTRALDVGARNGTRVETVPDQIMEEVLARLAPIFE